MAVDERRRSALYERLAAALGSDQATTMFELLPPVGEDVAVQSRVDHRFDAVDRRFEDVDRRFEDVDRRFDELERRIVEEARLTRAEVTAAFREELNAAVSGQARLVLTGSIATALSILAAAVAVAQLL